MRLNLSNPRDDGPKWTDKANFGVSFALFVCAVVALVVSYAQWDAAKDQLKFAQQSAIDAGKDTRASLEISRRAAAAAEAQAHATEIALDASGRLARAAEIQANGALRAIEATRRLAAATELQGRTVATQLEMERKPRLYISAEYKGFTVNNERWAAFTITNDSAYTINDIQSEEYAQPSPRSSRLNPWGHPDTLATYSLAPGEKKTVELLGKSESRYPSLTSLLITGESIYVFAMRLTFKDLDGKTYVEEQCLYLDFEENFRPLNCPGTKSNIILKRDRYQ